MGGTVSAGRDNDELVDNLVHSDCITSKLVEKVYRAVDRGAYYTEKYRSTAYEDSAWREKDLHLSAPSIYAKVMESLKLKRNLSFLNMGSGTGYLSTMVGLIIGAAPNSCNYGVEFHEETVKYANMKLEDFIQNSNSFDEYDFCEPKFFTGNCLNIYAEMKYDRIYCGAECPDSDLMYIKDLLKINGIAVVPMGHQLLEITRKSEEEFEQQSIAAVTFAELISSTQTLEVSLPEIEVPALKNLCRSAVREYIRQSMQRRLGDLNVRRMPRNEGDHIARFLQSRRVNSFVARYGNLAAAVANADDSNSSSDSDNADNVEERSDSSDEDMNNIEDVEESNAEVSNAEENSEEMDESGSEQATPSAAGGLFSADAMDNSDTPNADKESCSAASHKCCTNDSNDGATNGTIHSSHNTQSSLTSENMNMEESSAASSSNTLDSGVVPESAVADQEVSCQNDLSTSTEGTLPPTASVNHNIETGSSGHSTDVSTAASNSSDNQMEPAAPPVLDVGDDSSSSDDESVADEMELRRQRQLAALRLIYNAPERPPQPRNADDEDERALNRDKAHRYHTAFAQTMTASIRSLPIPTPLKDYLLYYRDKPEHFSL